MNHTPIHAFSAERVPLGAILGYDPCLDGLVRMAVARDERLAYASLVLGRPMRPGETENAFLVAAERALSSVPAGVEVTNRAPVATRFAVWQPGTIRWR